MKIFLFSTMCPNVICDISYHNTLIEFLLPFGEHQTNGCKQNRNSDEWFGIEGISRHVLWAFILYIIIFLFFYHSSSSSGWTIKSQWQVMSMCPSSTITSHKMHFLVAPVLHIGHFRLVSSLNLKMQPE